MGGMYDVVCAPVVAILSWQQATNLTAVIAHCGISPNKWEFIIGEIVSNCNT